MHMTDDIQARSDYENVKSDVAKLIGDVSSWITGASADAKQKWDETRPMLEEKLSQAQEQAQHIGNASVGAAGEMGKGFAGAFDELKGAFMEAKKHFEKPSDEAPAADDTAVTDEKSNE